MPTKLSYAEQSEEIYQAYPRKVAKQAAVEAIRKRLMDLLIAGHPEPYAYLLERTKLYAEGCRKYIVLEGKERLKFTPHPATWYNRQGDLDDEKWWSPPEVIRVL